LHARIREGITLLEKNDDRGFFKTTQLPSRKQVALREGDRGRLILALRDAASERFESADDGQKAIYYPRWTKTSIRRLEFKLQNGTWYLAQF